MQENVDYLIVGQGIAGTYLAHQLLKEGKRIKVIDKGFKSASSWVAAGVINPLVLKRLTTNWRVHEFLNFNVSFYQEMAKRLGKNHYYKSDLLKLISSKEEKEFWAYRYEKAKLEPFVKKELENNNSLKLSLTKDYVLGRVTSTAWVDLKPLLSDFRAYLKDNNLLLEDTFQLDRLNENRYLNIVFKKIVFCEGAAAKENPYCKNFPFRPNKGELLSIYAKDMKQTEMVKKKVFILPLGNQKFKVGATYDRDFNTTKSTIENRTLLCEMLKEITNTKFEIIEQEAGVRPALLDRRPLLGKLNEKNYFIFNGLGSKGCFIAPLLCKELVDYMENGKPLHPESDINRFANSN